MFSTGSKHHLLTFQYGGQSHKVYYSGSASDWRAEKNAVCDLRRKIKEVDGR